MTAHQLWEAINWGTVPDWLSGIGTVGALGATYSLLRIEVGRRGEQEDRDRRAQAMGIRRTPMTSSMGVQQEWRSSDGTIFDVVEIEYSCGIENRSDDTIHFAGVTLDLEPRRAVRARRHGHTDWDETPFTPIGAAVPVLPAGESFTTAFVFLVDSDRIRAGIPALLAPSVELTFIDMARRQWRRDRYDRLLDEGRVSDAPAARARFPRKRGR